MRGISPLIATVILIALTMAIAGLMAAFATQITSTKISESQEKSGCLGALELSSISFQSTILSVKISNHHERMNVSGFIADVDYGDPEKSKAHLNLRMKDYNFTDPLMPGTSDWFIYNTSDTVVPKSVFVFATSCGRDFGTRLIVR